MTHEAIGYIRYSPKPEEAELDRADTLEFQEAALRTYFDHAGIRLAEVIPDPLTSARLVPLHKRDGGRRLLELTTGRRPDYQIVGAYRLDRLFRDIADGVTVLRGWKKSKTAFHLTAEGGQSLNTSTAFGRMMIHTRLVYAEFEADLSSERTSASHLFKQHSNRRVSNEPPYGKMLDPDNAARWLECSEEQEVIERIVLLHSSGMTSASIATALNNAGVPARANTRWHPEKIKRILKRSARALAGV